MAFGITSTAVAVGDTATQLIDASGAIKWAWIHNRGGASIFLGDENVTTTTGLEVPDGEKLPLYSGYEDTIVSAGIYAIAAAAQISPADTRVMVARA